MLAASPSFVSSVALSSMELIVLLPQLRQSTYEYIGTSLDLKPYDSLIDYTIINLAR